MAPNSPSMRQLAKADIPAFRPALRTLDATSHQSAADGWIWRQFDDFPATMSDWISRRSTEETPCNSHGNPNPEGTVPRILEGLRMACSRNSIVAGLQRPRQACGPKR